MLIKEEEEGVGLQTCLQKDQKNFHK